MKGSLLLDILRGVIGEMRKEGVQSFTAADIQQRMSELKNYSPKQIDRALDQLCQTGTPIFHEAMGVGVPNLWRFGNKRATSRKRRPIGR